MQAPFFRALYALAVDDPGSRTGLTLQILPALDIERAIVAIDYVMIGPEVEITLQGALRRQFFGHVAPLASRARHIKQAVDHLRPSTERLRPPVSAGGVSGATGAHSS
jgi:hypothetical protein